MMLLHERLDTDSDAESTVGDTLVLEWSEPAAVSTFADAVLSVFGPTSRRIESVGSESSKFAAEVVQAIRWPRAERASLRLHLGNGSIIQVVCQDTATVRLIAPAARLEAEWLQASAHLRAPFGVVFVPSANLSDAMPFWRAMVGIASRCGELIRAGVRHADLADAPAAAMWSREPTGKPLVATALGTRFEVAATQSTPLDIRALCELLAGKAADTAALGDWLTRSARGCRIRIGAFEPGNVGCALRRPPTADACLFVVPEPDAVLLSYDPGLPTDAAAWALGHGLAHVVLGHVRPGDTHGHWDTRESFESPKPLHRWDRDVRAHLPAWCPPVPERRASLAECTAQEKAWLVLHDHIGRMVGKASALHPSVGHYRVAAYQRQAAQRLVAQLDQYGGAMLCDGVGLGKTYVAAAVIAHDCASWLDSLKSTGQSIAGDPYRVVVLAPNSVVSTWETEALPTLYEFGVPPAWLRVISHTKLQRVQSTSSLLEATTSRISDFEFLAMADLVVIDEAHNFRSEGARRTSVLKELLRLKPRKNQARRVLLLTATPVNNSLTDLKQQAGLMFSRPYELAGPPGESANEYRLRLGTELAHRVATARAGRKGADDPREGLWESLVAPPGGRISDAVDFDPQRRFGSQVTNLATYLTEEAKRLEVHQGALHESLKQGTPAPPLDRRIAGTLLDHVVVQRSRSLCKQIELEQGSAESILFRQDASAPEPLVYEDSFGDTTDLLARFLPLFSVGDDVLSEQALSFRVYMWAGVRENLQRVDTPATVVGLQRVLALKRLESSPVAFLVTVLRLLSLHAACLDTLWQACTTLGHTQAEHIRLTVSDVVESLDSSARDALNLLIGGESMDLAGMSLLGHWGNAASSRVGAEALLEDLPDQLGLFAQLDPSGSEEQIAQLERLLGLLPYLLADFGRLARTAPELAEIVFRGFGRDAWPRSLVRGGETVHWPRTSAWGRRIVTDAKLRRLVGRLLTAHLDGQKAIVFSQFTDSVVYIDSVLRATETFTDFEWTEVVARLGEESGSDVNPDLIRRLVSRSAWVAGGDREARESVVDAFAPYYRLLPYRPRLAGANADDLTAHHHRWERGWRAAMENPVDVLFATDVLAEGVNLQDASLLVNYDVHWNPVRMIQRSGRIDRRLNPRIEETETFPELDALASELGVSRPPYWWHSHRGAAPVIANLLLTDALEAQLQLRERIATKSLTIDFTLGLEQGTGAEADWMSAYKYQGISALNAWEGDRAIERVAGYQARLQRLFDERSIQADWIANWSGWIRETQSPDDSPLITWSRFARGGGDPAEHTRRIQPRMLDGVVHWMWTTERPAATLYTWLRIDGEHIPAPKEPALPFAAEASQPLTPDDLLGAARSLIDSTPNLFEYDEDSDVGTWLYQGCAALSRGFLGADTDPFDLTVFDFRILQLAPRSAAPHSRHDSRTVEEPAS